MAQPRHFQIWSLRLILLILSIVAGLLAWQDLALARSHAAPSREKTRTPGKSYRHARTRKTAKQIRLQRVRTTDGRLIAIIWAPQTVLPAALLDRDAVAGAVPLTEPERDRLEQSLQEDIAAPEIPVPTALVTEPLFVWPTAGPVGSGFGPRRGGFHAGIDITAPRHQPVVAASDGRVLYARASHGRMGKTIVLQHADGVLTIYAHLSSFRAREATSVRQGETIGAVGSTGRATGPHLHFAVRVDGTTVDPQQFLPAPSANDLPQQASAQ